MSFHEVQFPTDIALNAKTGPQWRTEIVALASGREERNSPWANARMMFNVGYGVRELADLASVTAFFNARRGRRYGFRFKDWSDYTSTDPGSSIAATDQSIGTGDGSTTTFQLVKAYTSGGETWSRSIAKPVSGTVLIAVAGVAQTEGVDFTVDTTTGVVTFLSGSIPAASAAVTAGYQFDVPVRFDTDHLPATLETGELGTYPDIPLIEVAGE